MPLWRSPSGKPYRNPGGAGPFAATQEDLEDCCCEEETPQECPDDCSECPSTITAVVSGIPDEGGYPDCDAGANGTYVLTRVGDGCFWETPTDPDTWYMFIDCIDGEWHANVSYVGDNPFLVDWVAPLNWCPQNPWTFSGASGFCTSGSLTTS